MAVQILMPQFGESVVEGTITKWLKSVGERVEEFEPLLEVNTDKVDTEVPSPAAGTLLAVLVPEGTTVRAGTPLAWIGEAGELLDEAAGVSAATMDIGERPAGFISPLVRRIAREHQVDLRLVQGSGEKGRITKKDIQAYIEKRDRAGEAGKLVQPAVPPATAAEALEGLPVSPSIEPQQVARPMRATGAELTPSPPLSAPVEEISPSAETLLPLNPVRRAIAEHMVISKRTSPHVTTVMEADLSRVTAHRQSNKEAFARDGVNLTFTAYFIAAAVQALKAHPLVNSSWSEEGILLHRQINIGMATSLGEEGLIVPVIKDADRLSLLGLARAINDLAARARQKKLQPEEVKGGTFTVTNHGVTGSLFATPIINQPQCAILGVGAIQKRAVVVSHPELGDVIAIRPMVYLSLTFDHRILDGAAADNFLRKVVELLENWS